MLNRRVPNLCHCSHMVIKNISIGLKLNSAYEKRSAVLLWVYLEHNESIHPVAHFLRHLYIYLMGFSDINSHFLNLTLCMFFYLVYSDFNFKYLKNIDSMLHKN